MHFPMILFCRCRKGGGPGKPEKISWSTGVFLDFNIVYAYSYYNKVIHPMIDTYHMCAQ